MQGRKRTGKTTQQGVSSNSRGALQQPMVQVKVEPGTFDPNDDVSHKQRLRDVIISKRKAQGLGDVHISFKASVKQELTPAEMEKRERRKEQNRRAARKCREKKKLLAYSTLGDFVQMQEDNRSMEMEIASLRNEKSALEQVLEEHKQSGCCKMMEAGSPAGVVPASPPENVVSPAPRSLYAENPTESLSYQSHGRLPSVEDYLVDIGPLSPDMTFTDLALETPDFMQLPILPDAFTPLSMGEMSPSRLPQPHPTPVGPSRQCLQLQDPQDCLKNIMPASPNTHNLALLGPVSPASTNHDRRSVSSDWSACSDQSHGFCVPSVSSPLDGFGLNGGLAAASGSCSDTEFMEQGGFGLNRLVAFRMPRDDMEDEDDEVFDATSFDGDVFAKYS